MTHIRAKLSSFFTGFAAKMLSTVEVSRQSSNQHEFHGTAELKDVLGVAKVNRQPTRFMYFNDSGQILADGALTWYDAREQHPTRSEYRLYYPANEAMAAASAGDTMVLAKRPSGELIVLIAGQDSTIESQLMWLFGIDSVSSAAPTAHKIQGGDDPDVGLLASIILENIGIETNDIWFEENAAIELTRTFPDGFPSTAEFSVFARQYAGRRDDIRPSVNPDHALMKWYSTEEMLFRTLEHIIVDERIRQGFDDVDEFISYSLSIHNRRKARAGRAFENHLATVFEENNLSFEKDARTEGSKKPDFLFPGREQYIDDDFPVDQLAILGAKTTCKDRWRQVLSEANRLDRKHLATLEPGISEVQTEEMRESSLSLVVPSELFQTFSDAQQANLLSISDFIKMVSKMQA